MAKDAAKQAMLLSLDNVNQMVGVRDAISTRSGLMVNSTGGYYTPVFEMPPNYRFIPREWANPAARVDMSPCALDPSREAFEVMKQHNKWCMVELLKKYAGRGGGELAIEENEFKRLWVEVLGLEANTIILFALMDIEQSSTEGNLRGISRVLIDNLGYKKEKLIKGIFLVGGD